MRTFSPILRLAWLLVFLAAFPFASSGASNWIWIEGEKASSQSMNRHPWWYDQVKRDQFSGGDFISNFNQEKPGEAEYRFRAEEAGEYEFWVRANPLSAKLAFSLNGGPETAIDLERERAGRGQRRRG